MIIETRVIGDKNKAIELKQKQEELKQLYEEFHQTIDVNPLEINLNIYKNLVTLQNINNITLKKQNEKTIDTATNEIVISNITMENQFKLSLNFLINNNTKYSTYVLMYVNNDYIDSNYASRINNLYKTKPYIFKIQRYCYTNAVIDFYLQNNKLTALIQYGSTRVKPAISFWEYKQDITDLNTITFRTSLGSKNIFGGNSYISIITYGVKI